jgi:hypothetical protein
MIELSVAFMFFAGTCVGIAYAVKDILRINKKEV